MGRSKAKLAAMSAAIALIAANREGIAVPAADSDESMTDAELLDALVFVAGQLDRFATSGMPTLRLLGEVVAWLSAGGDDE